MPIGNACLPYAHYHSSGPDSPSTQVPLPTLFNVLKSCPELTTLRLDMVIAPGSSDRNSEAVRLPLLDFLHIHDSLAYCEDVLVHLIFPATTRVEMYPQGITSGVDIHDILVPLRKISVLAAPIPTTLSIRVPRSNQENISHFSTATYLEPTFPAGLAREKLFGINSHPDYARVLLQIMTKVLKTLPSQEITHLNAGSAHLTVSSWRITLALLPALEKVYMHIDDAGTYFCEAVLDMEHHDPVDPFLNVLKRLLRAYRARGTPLIHLRLKDWFSNVNLNEAKWLELGDLVVDVAAGDTPGTQHNDTDADASLLDVLMQRAGCLPRSVVLAQHAQYVPLAFLLESCADGMSYNNLWPRDTPYLRDGEWGRHKHAECSASVSPAAAMG
ncbi:hypothetical protein C8R44DRAFT_892334 [Mycena epipterygia]|nr:hypothetical protein C8R44DRAFT_892334 [Mycena epipterygia]